MTTFPTAKIQGVENIISNILGLDVKFNIEFNNGYGVTKKETLVSQDLLEQMPAFAKVMWADYIIKREFKEVNGALLIAAKAHFTEDNGGWGKTLKIANFKIKL